MIEAGEYEDGILVSKDPSRTKGRNKYHKVAQLVKGKWIPCLAYVDNDGNVTWITPDKIESSSGNEFVLKKEINIL